ncbi:MAG: hypothetical protein D6824_02250, partial [Planctomycetota bacterium]
VVARFRAGLVRLRAVEVVRFRAGLVRLRAVEVVRFRAGLVRLRAVVVARFRAVEVDLLVLVRVVRLRRVVDEDVVRRAPLRLLAVELLGICVAPSVTDRETTGERVSSPAGDADAAARAAAHARVPMRPGASTASKSALPDLTPIRQSATLH